jgi:hypothetical protein
LHLAVRGEGLDDYIVRCFSVVRQTHHNEKPFSSLNE